MKTKILFLTFTLLSFMLNAQVGYINTIAGTGVAGHTGDGGLATSAKLGITFGIVIDSAGNIIFADNGNNAIRKVTASTGIISKVAGTYYTYNGTNWYYGGDGGLGQRGQAGQKTQGNLETLGERFHGLGRNLAVSIGLSSLMLTAARPALTRHSLATSGPPC